MLSRHFLGVDMPGTHLHRPGVNSIKDDLGLYCASYGRPVEDFPV